MSDRTTTARAFHEAGGVEDWRILAWGPHAYYRIDSFAEGARFVTAIAEIGDDTGHFPDVDLRPGGVTVHIFTGPDGSLSELELTLARRISEVAGELGLEPDPSQLQVVGIAVAEDADADVRQFWAAALGYEYLGDEDVVDPHRRNPHLWFHKLNPPRGGRGRVHIDVNVPAGQAEARVAAALAAGGRIADDSHGPEWWTLASPDNHGVDIAAWPEFEDGS